MPHMFAAQLATALANAHFVPQVPQLSGSVARVTSQPSPELPLQSPNPPPQTAPHMPQLARSRVTSAQKPPQHDSLPQLVPHPPQLVPSMSVLTQMWL